MCGGGGHWRCGDLSGTKMGCENSKPDVCALYMVPRVACSMRWSFHTARGCAASPAHMQRSCCSLRATASMQGGCTLLIEQQRATCTSSRPKSPSPSGPLLAPLRLGPGLAKPGGRAVVPGPRWTARLVTFSQPKLWPCCNTTVSPAYRFAGGRCVRCAKAVPWPAGP